MIISDKTSFGAEEKVLIECDFKVSPKCKRQYYKIHKNILLCRANNNGKDRCCYCFNTLTKTGKDNYNFKYNKNESFFSEIDSEFKAYMLGWIAGDGHIKNDGLYFSIHYIDADILMLFKEHCQSDAPITYSKRDNTAQWNLNSVNVVKDLLRHLELDGCGKKFDKIKIPSSLKEKFVWPFIRGLFDSDGHIATLNSKTTRPICSICSVSITMQNNLMQILLNNNIKFIKTKNNPQIIMGGNYCLKFMNMIYSDANFFLNRKHALWTIWKTWSPFMGTPFKPKKIRTHYKPMSEEHKNKIRESNRSRALIRKKNKELING